MSYCATCDGPLFADQKIAVVGGGNAALTEALHLARFAAKVIVIHRRDQLRADKILQQRAFATARIEFLWNGCSTGRALCSEAEPQQNPMAQRRVCSFFLLTTRPPK